MPFPFAKRFSICLVLSFALACRASPELRLSAVAYNFREEGFLDRDLLQTIGKAPIETGAGGIDADRVHCLARAREQARLRAVRVMIHVRSNIPALAASDGFSASAFESDYPRRLSEVELRRAESDFRALLARGYIALQDARSRDSCSVAFRIAGQDLPAEIRATPGQPLPAEDRRWTPRTEEPGAASPASPVPPLY